MFNMIFSFGFVFNPKNFRKNRSRKGASKAKSSQLVAFPSLHVFEPASLPFLNGKKTFLRILNAAVDPINLAE
jgi:hypothetical protein